ncbi:uncharacterized protein LOC131229229 isoform X2 [Magnolia sinica]|uniref:uncharacterized protein LOC131229229 isoform X2 n=1 Tax=Magnolia sinica TaxID=86752 RepID=UPI00265B71EB|nr:uncharacterized protein LOC131229229 isoform X2 [Magnolia sinica]
MSANGGSFVEWEEQFVSQERGNRVVHYFLKNSTGDSFLAVVGTERSLRHMVYVVSDEFLQVHGSEKSNIACFKWRSKREVVDWLTSLLSKQHCTRDHSKLATNDSTQNSGADHPATGFDERGSHPPNRAAVFARNLKVQNWDIVWSGTAWTCGKQLKHYQAFCRNGTTIPIHSFVLVMAKEENHYLAYLEDMYEDKKGQKKVKVRWFHQNQEVIGIIPLPTPHPREVFITPYSQVISAECVDGLASVLTPEHYEKCLEALPNASPGSIHFCFRQYRNNIVKPFNLSKLRGYFDQAVLSCLDLHVLSKSASHGSDGEEGEELSHVGTTRQGARKSRSCKVRPKFTMAHLGVRFSGHGSQITASGPAYQNLRFGLPGRRPLAVKYVGSQRWLTPPFKVGNKIELLCQDSGIRGCWFRCVVLEISRKQLKVRYDDVQNEDGCGNLEEWIPAFRSAAPDKLGMRSLGRLTIRPCPPHEKLNGVVEIGTPVDAWWNDGWWEGVLAGLDSGGDVLQVYFSGVLPMLLMWARCVPECLMDPGCSYQVGLTICVPFPNHQAKGHDGAHPISRLDHTTCCGSRISR